MKIYQQNFEAKNPADQSEKFHTLSEKYTHINTRDIETVFKDNGLYLVGESFGRSKVYDGYQKHLSVWTRDDLNLGDERLQLLLTNSHDGGSSFKLDTGVFRFVCANGMVSGDLDMSLKTRHSKNALERINRGIQYLLERLPNVAATVDQWKNIQLETLQRDILVQAAIENRIGKSVNRWQGIDNKRTRLGDLGNDLWTVFNVLQEKTIRGGLSYYDTEADQWKKTRKISAIDKTVKLNKGLWNIAETFAKVA